MNQAIEISTGAFGVGIVGKCQTIGNFAMKLIKSFPLLMANAKVFLESGKMCIGQACSAQDLREVDLVIPVQFSNRDEVLPVPVNICLRFLSIPAGSVSGSEIWSEPKWNIQLHSVPAHVVARENEAADQAAKEAADPNLAKPNTAEP